MTPQRITLAQVRHHWRIYLLALPALLLVAVFIYYPAFSGVYHSFFRWNGADINEYVGLHNYRTLLDDPDFWRSFRVAFILGFWNLVKMIPAIAVAVCIHRCRSARLQYFYRLAFVVPMVIPMLVVVLIWRGLFFETTSGYLNAFLLKTHLFDLLVWLDRVFHWGGIFNANELPAWLGDHRLILTACVVWGFPWVGSFAVLTHLAKLQNIPRELYEAADLDGVGWFRKFTKLEFPLMLGSINIMMVFVVIDTIKDAGTILALAGLFGGPGGAVTVPALSMLRKAFIDPQMGAACAVGVILTLVVLVLQKILLSLVQLAQRSRTRKRPRRAATPTAPTQPRPPLFLFSIFNFLFPPVILRAAKHAFIWLVLLLAYLPLYFMLIVSLKDNRQFYAAPAAITTPPRSRSRPL